MIRHTEARRPVLLLAILLVLSCLGGCSSGQSQPEVPAAAVAQAMADTQPEVNLYAAGPGDDNFTSMLQRVYGVEPEEVTDGCVLYADGISASEIAVLQFKSADAAREAAQSLQDYAARRQADFTGYAPDQEVVAAGARIVQSGSTLMLIMLPDPAAAEQAAAAVLSGEAALETARPTASASAPASQTAAASGYDHDAVLAALESGSPEGLSEDNRQVWSAVNSVMSSEITADMTPYEKEVAIHDWMTAHIQYDPAELSHPLLGAEPTPDNDNPVGALLAGKAICYGYSSTFQLFMDALGIPCITIDGQANYPAEAHSWNAVELDGQWYYVDVTWDDPATGFPDHDYLNQTTAYLEEHGPHIWERDGLPEIAAEPYRAA